MLIHQWESSQKTTLGFQTEFNTEHICIAENRTEKQNKDDETISNSKKLVSPAG